MELCDYEIIVLRICNGEDIPDAHWGAAMSIALESLCGRGFVKKVFGSNNNDGIKFEITDTGIRYLSSIGDKDP